MSAGKVVARRPREWPASRDFRSRAFLTRLDCSDAVADLDWHPEPDRERFLAEAFVAIDDRITAAPEPRNDGAEAVAARQ